MGNPNASDARWQNFSYADSSSHRGDPWDFVCGSDDSEGMGLGVPRLRVVGHIAMEGCQVTQVGKTSCIPYE